MTDNLSKVSREGLDRIAMGTAAKHGVRLDAAQASLIADQLHEQLRVGPGGTIIVLDGEGNPAITWKDGRIEDQSAEELIVTLARSMASTSSGPGAPTYKAVGNLTAKMLATRAAERSADMAKARAAELARGGNPWSKSTWNLTRQMTIINANPALAAEMKDQA